MHHSLMLASTMTLSATSKTASSYKFLQSVLSANVMLLIKHLSKYEEKITNH